MEIANFKELLPLGVEFIKKPKKLSNKGSWETEVRLETPPMRYMSIAESVNFLNHDEGTQPAMKVRFKSKPRDETGECSVMEFQMLTEGSVRELMGHLFP